MTVQADTTDAGGVDKREPPAGGSSPLGRCAWILPAAQQNQRSILLRA
jgi:hypothetical protein